MFSFSGNAFNFFPGWDDFSLVGGYNIDIDLCDSIGKCRTYTLNVKVTNSAPYFSPFVTSLPKMKFLDTKTFTLPSKLDNEGNPIT